MTSHLTSVTFVFALVVKVFCRGIILFQCLIVFNAPPQSFAYYVQSTEKASLPPGPQSLAFNAYFYQSTEKVGLPIDLL